MEQTLPARLVVLAERPTDKGLRRWLRKVNRRASRKTPNHAGVARYLRENPRHMAHPRYIED